MVFESLFQCTYPVPTEPVEFKTHPTIPEIEASRCGFVRCKVEDTPVRVYSAKTIGAIVMECWTGEILKPFTNVRHKNLNPYDFHLDNLEILVVDDPERIVKEKVFFDNTVAQMLIREEMFGDYRDMEAYFIQLGIPHKFIKGWLKKSTHHKSKQFENHYI